MRAIFLTVIYTSCKSLSTFHAANSKGNSTILDYCRMENLKILQGFGHAEHVNTSRFWEDRHVKVLGTYGTVNDWTRWHVGHAKSVGMLNT